MCYLLEFNKKKTFSGKSSTNKLQGNYEIDFTTHSIHITVGAMTQINELFDGKLYLETLNIVQSFDLQENTLRLYYNDKKNCLRFETTSQIIR